MISDFVDSILAKLNEIVTWFFNIFISMFRAIWDVLRDFVAWAFDQTLGVAVSALSAINVSGVSAGITAFGNIPANVMLVMSCIGLGQALGIITAALAIRFALQLIPFVRLGS